VPVQGSMSSEFWRGRRVLISGHAGFKGAWLCLWLRALGAKLSGYAQAPATMPNLWQLVGGETRSVIADIRDAARVREAVVAADPQIDIHMAARALVRESYRDPLGTYATNVLGTGALLQACRELEDLQCVLIVTSDKVYENHGAGRPFEEGDRLGGEDPYSNSKACAELLTADNRRALFIPKGFAHGIITLRDDTEILYMISVPYVPGAERGVRWNDPALAIKWPIEPVVISARDAVLPLLDASTAA